jgi:hypothetical protein
MPTSVRNGLRARPRTSRVRRLQKDGHHVHPLQMEVVPIGLRDFELLRSSGSRDTLPPRAWSRRVRASRCLGVRRVLAIHPHTRPELSPKGTKRSARSAPPPIHTNDEEARSSYWMPLIARRPTRLRVPTSRRATTNFDPRHLHRRVRLRYAVDAARPWARRRAAPGEIPINRLNARLNAASDW